MDEKYLQYFQTEENIHQLHKILQRANDLHFISRHAPE